MTDDEIKLAVLNMITERASVDYEFFCSLVGVVTKDWTPEDFKRTYHWMKAGDESCHLQ